MYSVSFLTSILSYLALPWYISPYIIGDNFFRFVLSLKGTCTTIEVHTFFVAKNIHKNGMVKKIKNNEEIESESSNIQNIATEVG